MSIFSSFDKAVKLNKKSYFLLVKKLSNKTFNLKNVSNINEVRLSSTYLNTLFLHNKKQTMTLALNDRCSMIDLLNTDLLHGPNGKIKNVIFEFINKKGKKETHALKVQTYLKLIGYQQCKKSKNLKKHFNTKNLRNTLKLEKITHPNSLSECQQVFESFIKSPKTPYICDITNKITSLHQKEIEFKNTSQSNYRKHERLSKQITKAKRYKKIIKPESLFYLTKFCNNLNSRDNFCSSLFKENHWSNAIKGSTNRYSLQFYCTQKFTQSTLTKTEFKQCANILSNQPNACTQLGANLSTLLPSPPCNQLSTALNFSKLYKEYNDCPAQVGHDSLVTVSRVLNHLDKNLAQEKTLSCELNSSLSFAKFNRDFMADQFWQINLCYDDKIQRKKICYPTLLNDANDYELSFTKNIEKILSRLRGFNKNSQRCQIIFKEDFKPNLLKYKTGCYIVKEKQKCYATKCSFKVIYDDREFKNYVFESNLSFDVLPFRLTEENRSFIHLIKRYKHKKIKSILNISSFKRISNHHKDAIFLGVGCAENLLPSFFKPYALNQCSITTFILDGLIEENGRYSIITHTAFDQIHAPRIIPWPYIFSAIKNYQGHHPLNQWGLIAIY